jgi:hypothetical protein
MDHGSDGQWLAVVGKKEWKHNSVLCTFTLQLWSFTGLYACSRSWLEASCCGNEVPLLPYSLSNILQLVCISSHPFIWIVFKLENESGLSKVIRRNPDRIEEIVAETRGTPSEDKKYLALGENLCKKGRYTPTMVRLTIAVAYLHNTVENSVFAYLTSFS